MSAKKKKVKEYSHLIVFYLMMALNPVIRYYYHAHIQYLFEYVNMLSLTNNNKNNL